MKTRGLFVIRLLCFLFLAGLAIVEILQHGAIARASLERQALLKESEEVDRLTREDAEIAQLRAANHELDEFRPRQRELARLRNEVGRLRPQAEEAAKLRAENQRLASFSTGTPRPDADAMPAGFIPKAAMADAGLGTPEAAVQTYFYAMAQGNIKRALECRAVQEQMTPHEEQDQSEMLLKHFASFPGFMIAETKIISDNEEQIGIQSTPGGTTAPVHLVRIGSEWKVK